MKALQVGLRAAPVLLILVWTASAEMVTLRVGTPPEQVAAGKRPSLRPKPPLAYVARTKRPVSVDGRLEEAPWEEATKLSLGRTLDGNSPAGQPTTVLLLRDAGTLYVGVRCGEARMDRIRPGRRGKDVDVWTGDSIEVFLGTGGAYYHFGVNPAGGMYDARGKNGSWDLPVRVATARDKDHWTAEMALPLAKMANKEPPPVKWIANFNRSRYAAGSLQEYAWSPTFSGDSHVPERFGKLILADPPSEEQQPQRPQPQAPPVQVLPVRSGVAVVRIDLSALPMKAKVHRADLRLFRDMSVGGDANEPLARIKVYPVLEGAGTQAESKPSGEALALRGPWFESFDATQAVRAWARGRASRSRVDFFIKVGPPLQLENTCLEIVYEGKPKKLPAQVAGVRALHRAGQTFITWKDAEDVFGDKPVTWRKLRDYLRDTDPQRRIRYRIYRHSSPIDASTIKDAVLLAEVGPLSGFNINSWSLERLINQTVFGNADQGELSAYGPFSGWNVNSPQGGRLIIPRFAVEDGKALPPGTGLYVHSAAVKEKVYYAVTVLADGVENLADFSQANSLSQPVAEVPSAWEPAEQPPGGGFGFDFRGKRHFYVTWVAAPLAPRPMYFNWSVLVPPDCDEPRPVELYFHAPSHSYARPPVKFLDRSIQICPHDFPFSGWYGYNEAAGTLKSPVEGVVRPYTIRRVEAFLKWARGEFLIDPSRIVAVGGDGAAMMALYQPETFAYVLITGFEARQLNAKVAGQYVQAWGPASAQIQDENGRSKWSWGELDTLLCGKRLPAVVQRDGPAPQADASAPGFKLELPLFVCRSYSWGRNPAYGHGRGRFYYALQATRHALHAHWAWGGRLTAPEKYSGLWQGLDIRNTTPIPAITSSSADREGEGSGQTNAGYTWRGAKEDASGLEVTIAGPASTFDLTPRRMSKFKVRPGQKLAWQAFSTETPHWNRAKTKPAPISGVVTADSNGLITLKGLELARGYLLTVRIEKAK